MWFSAVALMICIRPEGNVILCSGFDDLYTSWGECDSLQWLWWSVYVLRGMWFSAVALMICIRPEGNVILCSGFDDLYTSWGECDSLQWLWWSAYVLRGMWFSAVAVMICIRPEGNVILCSGCDDLLATCSYQNIRIWHVHNCEELLRITVRNMTCNTIAITNDGSTILSGQCSPIGQSPLPHWSVSPSPITS